MHQNELNQNNELKINSKKIQSMLEFVKNSLNIYSEFDDNKIRL